MDILQRRERPHVFCRQHGNFMDKYEFEILFFAVVVFAVIIIFAQGVAHYLLSKHGDRLDVAERNLDELRGRNDLR